MCSIFGFVNYSDKLKGWQLKELVKALSIESEVRGKDASGIAYVKNGEMTIFKQAKPAHKMRFYFPAETKILIGHTRMTTQGSPKKNYNNHPFLGRTKDGCFALAHNGVLYNDKNLKESEGLSKTCIETDSYVAVQLLEKYGELSFETIAKMSEAVFGSFVFTMLADDKTLYISKDDNPLCLLHFKELGLYVYASTKEIMAKAIARCFLKKHTFEGVPVEEGEIIRIDSNGELERGCFMVDEKYYGYAYGLGRRLSYWDDYCDYLDEMGQGDLFEVCSSFGLSQDDLLLLYEMGYDDEEIETMLYDTDLLRQCVDEARVCINEYY